MTHAAILTKDKILAATRPGDVTSMMIEALGNFPPEIMEILNAIATNQIFNLMHINRLESLLSQEES